MQIIYKNKHTANPYCVPAALAGCLGISVEEATGLLLQRLGDVTISGLHTSFIIPILEQELVSTQPIDPPPSWIWLLKQRGSKFLVVLHYHVVLVADGLIFDNQHPNGHADGRRYRKPQLVWLVGDPLSSRT
jgi:hypothetical protein